MSTSPISTSPIEEDLPIAAAIFGPPGTGKTTLAEIVRRELEYRTGVKFLGIDNEDGFSVGLRAECSIQSGHAVDSPAYAKSFGKQGQIGYQKALGKYVSQGHSIVFTGPFEAATAPVGDKTVFKLLQELFAACEFLVVYVLLWPDEATPEELADPKIMKPVEDEIRRRLVARGEGDSAQQLLDAPKIADPTYYQKRALMVRDSAAALGIQIVRASIGESVHSIALRVIEALLEQRKVAS